MSNAGIESKREVLSKARYRTGRECEISPVDFALGWGCMSNQAVIDKLDISQGGRWYEYHWSNFPPVEYAASAVMR
jgi:hypothetical protein